MRLQAALSHFPSDSPSCDCLPNLADCDTHFCPPVQLHNIECDTKQEMYKCPTKSVGHLCFVTVSKVISRNC